MTKNPTNEEEWSVADGKSFSRGTRTAWLSPLRNRRDRAGSGLMQEGLAAAEEASEVAVASEDVDSGGADAAAAGRMQNYNQGCHDKASVLMRAFAKTCK